jgi:hypothetical protein
MFINFAEPTENQETISVPSYLLPHRTRQIPNRQMAFLHANVRADAYRQTIVTMMGQRLSHLGRDTSAFEIRDKEMPDRVEIREQPFTILAQQKVAFLTFLAIRVIGSFIKPHLPRLRQIATNYLAGFTKGSTGHLIRDREQ